MYFHIGANQKSKKTVCLAAVSIPITLSVSLKRESSVRNGGVSRGQGARVSISVVGVSISGPFAVSISMTVALGVSLKRESSVRDGGVSRCQRSGVSIAIVGLRSSRSKGCATNLGEEDGEGEAYRGRMNNKVRTIERFLPKQQV